MAYVIAEPCIGTKDHACVDACPVDCIHPKKDSAKFESEEMLLVEIAAVWAVPRVARGLNVRAKSNPTIDPGPPTEITTTKTVSSHSGARAENARTTVQIAVLLTMIPSTIHDLRRG